MFYESQHSAANLIKLMENVDFSFPAHLHEAFELILVTEGNMTVTIEDSVYPLAAGEAVLVFPDEVHSLSGTAHSRDRLCIFSPKLVKAFMTARQGVVPLDHRFAPSEDLRAFLFSQLKEWNVYRAKSALYLLAAEFDEGREYRGRSVENDTLLPKILTYVKDNFAGACTLESLAGELAYSYFYLSRYFKERMGMTFTEYVVRYRVNEACYQLTNSGESVTNVALACGFDSLRSFHRNFKAETGKTPGEYRKVFSSKM